MTDAPNTAKAVGGFNLTAQPLGFLQPLFAGDYGDNKTYIQRLDDLTTISCFDAVAWPERDTVVFDDPAFGTVNEESLWSFAFPNERPLVLPWTKFREFIAERIETSAFADHPLLQFDLVQTLDLNESKPAIFSRAFRAYSRAGEDVAERWRDRAIAEPELIHALRAAGIHSPDLKRSLRTSIEGGVARIELSNLEPAAAALLEKAYRAIAQRYEQIFPKVQTVEILPRRRSESLPIREDKPITIILIGKLGGGEFDGSAVYDREIDVIRADHLSSHLRRRKPSSLLIALGRQTDWPQIVDVGHSIKHLRSLAVILSAANEPMASDGDLQLEIAIPSILTFALAPKFTRKATPLKSIRPLLDIFSLSSRRSRTSFEIERMPARHCLLLREEIRHDIDANEIGCRLAARAIRGGVRPGARIEVFADESPTKTKVDDWESIFEPIFLTSYPSEGPLPKHGAQSYLTLLADRSFSKPISQAEALREGIAELLMMRGWRVKRDEKHLDISAESREFSAIIVERREDIPAEGRALQRPSFGRSHLLVIHVSPNREALLIGNRGQYSHITIEDISLMRPDSQWLWPVLRRQLDSRPAKASLAALRLASSLAVEAISMERIVYSANHRDGSLDQLVSLLEADDCERFVSFIPKGSDRDEGLRLLVRGRELSTTIAVDPELILSIEDDGPAIVLDW
ncbi:hypothetical protein [Bradyrhizobium sp. 1]|uniref:hypothetical protein n=1 Tax=Bradyrhizobium sp. 1 TaxID=241591 RepID=UPI001FFB6572|nr:hypothetical protein [Bradyrhizobium sp. 1]MCK1394013.1 hypothetical protein [Bradyrhizobium sp. 1]